MDTAVTSAFNISSMMIFDVKCEQIDRKGLCRSSTADTIYTDGINRLSIMTIGRLKILSIGLTTLFLGTISSAMSVSSECAVVGCGVLGTSLCKQFLEKHEFESTKGMY